MPKAITDGANLFRIGLAPAFLQEVGFAREDAIEIAQRVQRFIGACSKNVHAGLHLSGVPLASGSTDLTIPSIVIEDFKSDGDTTKIVAQLTRVLLQAILEEAVSLAPDLLKDLGSNLEGLQGTIESGAKDALKGLEGALKGAGGLFDKK